MEEHPRGRRSPETKRKKEQFMMKRALIAALCTGSLFAYNHPCPDNWQFSGDFLYLMPTVDDTYYVITQSDGGNPGRPVGTIQNNDFGFAPGYRVGAEYSWCGPQRELQAFYSYLNTDQTSSVSNTANLGLWATTGHADNAANFENYRGTATSKNSLLYQRLDVVFTQQMINTAGVYLFVAPGLELSSLHMDTKNTYVDTGALLQMDVKERSRYEGIGPQMGIEMGYNFYEYNAANAQKSQKGMPGSTNNKSDSGRLMDSFSINAVFSGSLLASRGWESFRSSTLNLAGSANAGLTTVTVNTTDATNWRMIPALHARVGLNYSAHWSWGGVALGAGYEFQDYIRGLVRKVYSDDIADGLTENIYYNFDLQGLYVSAAVSF